MFETKYVQCIAQVLPVVAQDDDFSHFALSLGVCMFGSTILMQKSSMKAQNYDYYTQYSKSIQPCECVSMG